MSAEVVVTLTYGKEEAHQVVRCLDYYIDHIKGSRDDYDRMLLIRSAIRGSIPPPKPDEPMGLGAVVEAINGNDFVRVSSSKEGWLRVQEEPGSTLYRYEEIAAVAVLHEGVTQ